jgi:porphobilinogen deaminase
LIGVVARADGKRLCRSELSAGQDEAAELGRRLAEELLQQGAAELLGTA